MSDVTADMQLLSAVVDDPQRSAVVTRLAERTPPVSLAELAAAVEVHRDESGAGAGRPDIELHHVHLPVLADAGLLQYDPETHTVDYDTAALEELLAEYKQLCAEGSTELGGAQVEQASTTETASELSTEEVSSPSDGVSSSPTERVDD